MVISAYLAEVVRAGLQAIPCGQYEAAAGMGLPFWPTTILIVLPQALRVTIPALVNTFIAFFKDTSLVAVIGLFDLLGAAKAVTSTRNGSGSASKSTSSSLPSTSRSATRCLDTASMSK